MVIVVRGVGHIRATFLIEFPICKDAFGVSSKNFVVVIRNFFVGTGRVPNAEFIKTSVGEVAGTCVWRLTADVYGPAIGELSGPKCELSS